jgi:hypothetical protein
MKIHEQSPVTHRRWARGVTHHHVPAGVLGRVLAGQGQDLRVKGKIAVVAGHQLRLAERDNLRQIATGEPPALVLVAIAG